MNCMLKLLCLQFGGLEAVITGVCDIFPWLNKRRWLCVLVVVTYCFLGSLPTLTYVGDSELCLFNDM